MAVFGCDIGNGFAFVSLIAEGGASPAPALPPDVPRSGVPTTAYVRADGSLAIDAIEVEEAGRADPGRVVATIKRRFDEPLIVLPPSVEGGNEDSISPEAVYAAVAQHVLDMAFNETRESTGQAVHNMVLAYPASFDDHPELIDRLKVAVAGIVAPDGAPYVLKGLIPEPAAVALDYLAYIRHEVPDEERRLDASDVTVIVYDLGHGTFDTALVTARAAADGRERPWVLHDSAGVPDVGGVDFDETLVGMLNHTADQRSPGARLSPLTRSDIRSEAVKCKHVLSERESAPVRFMLDDYTPVELTVERAEFEEMSSFLLDSTVEKVFEMVRTARLKGIEPTHLVLSGGASRMPMVERVLREAFEREGVGLEIVPPRRPSETVSFGAARYGARLEAAPRPDGGASAEAPAAEASKPSPTPEMVVLTSRETGVVVPGAGQAGGFTMLIDQDVALPTTSEPLQVQADGTECRADIARLVRRREELGDDAQLGRGDWTELGRLWCDGLTPGARYALSLTMEKDGSFRCDLTDKAGAVRHMSWR